MLTPRDIENPDRVSGYSHVGYNVSPGKTAKKPYQAYDPRSGGPTKKHRWKGPRRLTALEAAYDYCAYMNSNESSAVVVPLKSAGHTAKRDGLRRDPELEAALGLIRDRKGEQAGKQGYVYLIAEADANGAVLYGTTNYCKIGFSTNPEARVAELQTGNPRNLVLVGKVKGTVEDEAAMHQRYIKRNILQEWFWMSYEMLSEFIPSEQGARLAA